MEEDSRDFISPGLKGLSCCSSSVSRPVPFTRVPPVIHTKLAKALPSDPGGWDRLDYTLFTDEMEVAGVCDLFARKGSLDFRLVPFPLHLISLLWPQGQL